MSNKKSSATITPAVVTIEDVKGIVLSSSEQTTLASQIQEAEMALTAACHTDHKNTIDGYIAIGKSVLALRAVVESNLGNLGNYTSFKAWMADRKFGPRALGYKQCTLYSTIAKNADVARDLYNNEGIWALSALASAVNEAVGNVKSGGRKASSAEGASESEGDAVTSEVTANGVTSIEAVLAFIAQAEYHELEMIALAARKRLGQLEGAE